MSERDNNYDQHDTAKYLKYCIERQMDIQNAMYPDKIPSIGPEQLETYGRDSFPAFINLTEEIKQRFPIIGTDVGATLQRTIGGVEASVAVTPLGNADSPLFNLLFVKPHIQKMAVEQLLELLDKQASDAHSDSVDSVAYYMQSQDGNIAKEFHGLVEAEAVPEALDFAERIWGRPEAVNLWIGDSKTTSRLHCDNYENIYVQVSGTKEMYLIPPGDSYCLDEKFLLPATYRRHTDGSFDIALDGTDIVLPGHLTGATAAVHSIDMDRVMKACSNKVMFPTVDPSDSRTQNDIYRMHSKPYKVMLKPGDVLYIPALWYHQVRILPDTGNQRGINVSVNYWHNASTISPMWTRWDFIRGCAAILHGYIDSEYFDLDDTD